MKGKLENLPREMKRASMDVPMEGTTMEFSSE